MINFTNSFVSCSVKNTDTFGKINITGSVSNPLLYKSMMLIASSPIDRMINYSGSGLPFPCSDIAFENTPNKLIIDSSGNFNTNFYYPNSYYTQGALSKIPPSIFFILETSNGNKEYVRFELPDMCVIKSLVNRFSRKGPEFYAAKDYLLPVANAENVMRSYAKLKVEYDVA